MLLQEAIFPCDLQCKADESIARQKADYMLRSLKLPQNNVKVKKCSDFLRLATQFFVARQVAKREGGHNFIHNCLATAP